MSKITAIIASLVAVPVVAFAIPAFAASPGQLEGGTGVYVVKNVTQNGSYAPSTTASQCDEVEYSIRLHNTAFGGFTDVQVNVDLPTASSTSNVSTMTATTNLGGISGTSGTATVNMNPAESLSYENGTTVLYDQNGNVIKTLPDTITSSGVDIGSLNGSTTEFVNFKAKVNCPTPVTPLYTCDALTVTAGDNKTVTVNGLKTTAQNGATFTNGTINWGDGSATTTATNVTGLTHQYANSGTFTIAATANFSVNGKNASATSAACSQAVSFSGNTPVTPPATPAAPTTLVNTGAGSVIGVFAAAVAAGTLGYRVFLGRRLSRQ